MSDNKTPIKKDVALLIRDTFLDNEELLKAMRAVALGLNPTEVQKSLVATAMANDELYGEIKQRLLPSLEYDYSIGQIGHPWAGVQSMIYGQTADTISQSVGYKQISIELTQKALELFRNPDGEINVDPTPSEDDPFQIKLLGMLQYMEHIETQLSFLYAIAENHRETKEQLSKKQKKDNTQ